MKRRRASRATVERVTIWLGACLVLAACAASTGQPDPDAADTQLSPNDATTEEDGTPGDEGCADLADGAPCDDDNPCTLSDQCAGGICVGGPIDPCDALDTCQSGTCDPKVGCVYGDAADGTACEAPCFNAASCEAGACVEDPEAAVVCPAPETPCIDQLACDAATGECTVEIPATVDTTCDTDDDLCTVERCDGMGNCFTAGDEDCSEENLDKPCWTWTCNAKNGCVQTAFVEEVSCDDHNLCTVSDTCTVNDLGQELCVGEAIPIDDDNPCTSDSCVQGTITHDPIDGAVCEPDCGGPGLCEAGACVATDGCGCAKDSDCADIGDVCTGLGYCDATTGECEIDTATAIVCPEVTAPCAIAICDVAVAGCALAPAPPGTMCDNELGCIQGGQCNGNLCQGGVPLTCDDDDPCTVDLCVPSQGCTHTPSDDEACTGPGSPGGMVAWYRFEETSGEVLDSSGNGHHGDALGGGITRGEPGAIGNSVAFNGSDGRVQVPAHPDLDFSTGATLEAWVWLGTTNGGGSVVSRGTGNNDNCVLMNSSQGNMQTIFQAPPATTNVTSASGEIPVETWTHVAVTNDGTTLTLYFDGVLNTTAPGGNMVALVSDLFIGRREQGVFSFQGRIDEVKWWTTVRSPEEICHDAEGQWLGDTCNL